MGAFLYQRHQVMTDAKDREVIDAMRSGVAMSRELLAHHRDAR
jgi:hypothetical protein